MISGCPCIREYRLGKKGNNARPTSILFVIRICGECITANDRRQPSLCRRELARRLAASFAQTDFRPALEMRPGFFSDKMCCPHGFCERLDGLTQPSVIFTR